MSIDAQTIITGARRHVRQTDPDNANLTDSDLLVYINEGTALLSRELKTYTKVRRYDSVYQGAKQHLPGDCYRIQHVTDSAGVPLQPLTLAEIQIANFADGLCYGPNGWCVFGNFLWVVPTMVSTVPINLLYAGRVPDIGSEDGVIDCPATWERALVIYLARAYLEEIESPRAGLYGEKFAAELAALTDAENDRRAPLPTSPRIPPVS